MTPSPDCLALIKQFEGLRLTAYPDPGTGGAPWTIGYGSTRDEKGLPVKPGTSWPLERAEARLASDVEKFAAKVVTALGGAPTTQHQFDALVSFAYNVGIANLSESTLLKKHKARDYSSAAAQFANWNKAGKPLRPMPGLTRRRAAEAALYGRVG